RTTIWTDTAHARSGTASAHARSGTASAHARSGTASAHARSEKASAHARSEKAQVACEWTTVPTSNKDPFEVSDPISVNGETLLSPEQREEAWERLGSEQFDVVVIGGGVVGAGAALDAATRGLKVALVEARDFASGTSSRSSKMFHGGLRYLEQLE